MPTLSRISVDTVKHAADLAYEAVSDRQRYVAGVQDIDLSDQEAERGSRNPTDLDALDVMPAEASAALDQLQSLLAGLSTEERVELRAVMLVGRGDYAAKEWEAALDQAAAPPDASSYADIAEKIELHDYLMKGLFALDLMKNGR